MGKNRQFLTYGDPFEVIFSQNIDDQVSLPIPNTGKQVAGFSS